MFLPVALNLPRQSCEFGIALFGKRDEFIKLCRHVGQAEFFARFGKQRHRLLDEGCQVGLGDLLLLRKSD